jgi:hypothetical protein
LKKTCSPEAANVGPKRIIRVSGGNREKLRVSEISPKPVFGREIFREAGLLWDVLYLVLLLPAKLYLSFRDLAAQSPKVSIGRVNFSNIICLAQIPLKKL